MVISPQVIGRIGQNLVWQSFSINPSCVANYKEISRRGHVNFMLIWYGMTQMGYKTKLLKHDRAGWLHKNRKYAIKFGETRTR